MNESLDFITKVVAGLGGLLALLKLFGLDENQIWKKWLVRVLFVSLLGCIGWLYYIVSYDMKPQFRRTEITLKYDNLVQPTVISDKNIDFWHSQFFNLELLDDDKKPVYSAHDFKRWVVVLVMQKPTKFAHVRVTDLSSQMPVKCEVANRTSLSAVIVFHENISGKTVQFVPYN